MNRSDSLGHPPPHIKPLITTLTDLTAIKTLAFCFLLNCSNFLNAFIGIKHISNCNCQGCQKDKFRYDHRVKGCTEWWTGLSYLLYWDTQWCVRFATSPFGPLNFDQVLQDQEGPGPGLSYLLFWDTQWCSTSPFVVASVAIIPSQMEVAPLHCTVDITGKRRLFRNTKEIEKM